MPGKTQLTGPEKAVLMLLSMEEAIAAPIVAELEPNDVKKMREIAAMMREVPRHALDGLYGEFVEQAQKAVAVPKGGIAYLRRLAEKAMGASRSEELFVGAPASPFERLEKADAQAIASLLESEHPQIGAAILSQIDPGKAAKIVGLCDSTLRTELVSRMALMTEVPASILESVAGALAKQLPDGAQATVSVDGVAAAASLLKKLGAERSQEVLTALEGESVAEEIRAAMFTMEDLRGLDVRILRMILKEVPQDTLVVAMKTASEELKAKIFSSMSTRAADLLKDELESLGAVRLADVEAAQRGVVEAAKALEASGRISLSEENGSV